MRGVPHDSAAAHAAAPSEPHADTANAPMLVGGSDDKGSVVVSLSFFADKGTRWEPTHEEQDCMTRIFVFWLTTASLI